jgi:hypothetical protein
LKGAVDPRTAILDEFLPPSLISKVIIANTPQLILSILYFSYNALFTAMLMGYEWVSYSRKRKGLRVSHKPSGAQRSTYFLQLPYRFSIPLMLLSGTLHWLISQSIFLIAIEYYDEHGKPNFSGNKRVGRQYGYTTLGYSLLPIVFVIVLGAVMVTSIMAIGFIPYKRGMTLAGSSSMAISAACHPNERSEDGESIAEKKLQWGVVNTGVDRIGRCAFSGKEVTAPVKGELYG